jgi:hypothetical protein
MAVSPPRRRADCNTFLTRCLTPDVNAELRLFGVVVIQWIADLYSTIGATLWLGQTVETRQKSLDGEWTAFTATGRRTIDVLEDALITQCPVCDH